MNTLGLILFVIWWCPLVTPSEIQINCGERRTNYSFNNTNWQRDDYFSGGYIQSTKNLNVPKLCEKSRGFSRKHHRPFVYNIPVVDNRYRVELFFAETNTKRNHTGRRFFDVVVEGQTIQKEFDIFQQTGELYTLTSLSTSLLISDGNLTVELVPRKFQPIICAIRAVPEKQKLLTWKKISTSVPIPRHEACFVMVQGRAYLIGGRRKSPISVWDGKRWGRERGPGFKLHHMQCVVDKEIIWIVSAWTGNCCSERPVSNVIAYNTATKTWFNKTGIPEGRQRGSAASVLRGRQIFVVGGNRGGHGSHASALPWVDAYNIETDKWTTQLPDAPHPRDHAGGGLVAEGKLLCVAGGRNSGTDEFFNATVLPTDCFDFEKGIWETKASIPTGRAGSAYGTSCDGHLVVAGGEGHGRAWDVVDVFDGFEWRPLPSLAAARHGTGLAVDCQDGGNKLYIASGAGTQGGSLELDTAEELSY